MQIVTVLLAVVIFLILIWGLVAILLFARKKLVPEGKAKIKINQETEIETEYGCTLLQALTNESILMPSGCGGGGTCGTCKGVVQSGGGSLLPTETVHINRKMAQDQYRLFCQVKVKNDMEIEVPQEIFSVKKWHCEVISNRNVATFIKELVLKLPEGETMDFRSGGYVQVHIPKCYVDFKKFEVDEKYRKEWEQLHIFELNMKNTAETGRAYSMANHPLENDRIVLNVRIATPPFDKKKGGFQRVKPGIGSSYIYSLQTGDKVIVSGPYGDFFIRDTQNEIMFIGGGAGMAPMRSHIFDLFKTKHTRRKTSFWYGGRSCGELFYMNDFSEIEQEYDNFTFTVALSDPKKEDQWNGHVGFIHQVILEHYLKEHPSPEEIEYYICGPPMMLKAVLNMLAALGVPSTMIFYDDFGN